MLSIPQVVSSGYRRIEVFAAVVSVRAARARKNGRVRTTCLGRMAAAGWSANWLASQAAEKPDRTVTAAKSWLVNHRVDRHQAILPWNAPAEVAKVSPVTACQRYLEHLVAAWEAAFPDAPIAEQQVVVTVPASFDASARELTREAALDAGLPESFLLLEEPQAAVYAWLAAMSDQWRRLLAVGDTLLVCDVGGGTTDLTLVGVSEQEGELALERIAVGNHLLVGGDNMDVALAHHVAGLFAEKGIQLDPWQSVSLWHSCRTAKETLLADDGPATHPISVLGRGSRLIGGTVSVEVDAAKVHQLLIDGFFPNCGPDDRPQRQRASGFQEIGLPFESDTAITRHVAAFLQDHGEKKGKPVLPSHVSVQRRRVQGRGDSQAAARGARRIGAEARPSCGRWKGRRTWTTPWLAARPITAGPSCTAASGSAAARLVPTTSASRPRGWRCPARPVRCTPCAWCRSAWRKAPKPRCPVEKSAWSWAENRPVPLLRLRRPQGRQAGRRAHVVERRRTARDRSAGGRTVRRERSWTNPTCRYISNRGSPSWGCSSCGASAHARMSVGSWSSTCAKRRKADGSRLAASTRCYDQTSQSICGRH